MAKKIEWTRASIRDRFNIYQFWMDRNKSDRYCKKLEILFSEAAKLISEFPEIGIKTDLQGLRFKVVKNYKLFYLNKEDAIQIVRVWDARQDPEKFKL